MDDNNSKQPVNPIPEHPVKNQRGNLPIILGVVVLLLVVGGGAYYLGTQRTDTSTNTDLHTVPTANPTTQALPTTSPTESTNQQTSSIPSDWTLKSSTYCAVKFPVPPNKEPYFEFIGQDTSNPQNKRLWQLRESSLAEDGHKIFTNNSSLMYVADIEASGYIAGLVGVRCAPKASYSLANIAESYAAGFGTDAGIKVKSKKTIQIWGKDVVAAKFEGGMFSDNEIYFVLVGDKVYKVDKRSDSDKELVKNTTDQIFNNLQFSN
jgi:hypothetical protein